MLLEARRARHGMHVVASVRLAESTSNKMMHFMRPLCSTTRTQTCNTIVLNMLRRHDLHMDTCTPDIDPDDHTCYIRALCALSHAHLGSYGNRRPRGGGWRAPERPQTPPDGWLLHAA